MYGHHHTGLGALLLAITALFTRIVRFLVHHPHLHHIPGLGQLKQLLAQLVSEHGQFRHFADALLDVIRNLFRR